jgi:hypothetical protein
MEHWWNDTDRGKLKYWEKNLSQCYFVHHKSQVKGPGVDSLGVSGIEPVGFATRLLAAFSMGLQNVGRDNREL